MSKDNFNVADLSAALNEEDRAGLAFENKPQNLTDQHSAFLESLSLTVRKRVEVLREIESQHDELDAKFSEERAALDAKYQKLHQALYTKRHEIVNGVVEVEVEAEDEAANDQEGEKAAGEKGIPDFWLVAMKNNEVLAEVITERDEGALKYLKDIKWCGIEDSKGFKLEFFFDPNPYFKNTVLTKTYVDAGCILLKATGTEIEWYPGKWLPRTLVKEKHEPNTKIEDGESFFNFFNPPQVPEDDEDIDDDDAEELENQMDEDYEIGLTIRDQIIRHAVSWFTAEAIQELEDGIDDDDDDDSQADNIEEDDDDDKEEEDDDDDEGKTEKK